MFSLFLALCMLLSGLPWAPTVVAVESENIPNVAIENEDAPLNNEITIVEEDISLRGEYEKHFLMSDGSYQAVVYSSPVHELVDGIWVEIESANPNARDSATTDTEQSNIIDNYVLQGAGVQDNTRDRLYIGNRSAGLTRAFIRFATMPTLPSGAIITDATMTLHLTSGTSTAANASAYQVADDWQENTISWSNMPSLGTLQAANISHNNVTYYQFSCLEAVRDWYTNNTSGQNQNYGIMLRYYDESIDDYNAVYSANHTDATKHPTMSITYQIPTSSISVVEDCSYQLSLLDVTETVTWTSSNTTIATVDSSGKVTGVNAGTATISASVDNNIQAIYTVYVRIADGVYRIKNANIGLYLATYGGTIEQTSVRLLAYSDSGDTKFHQLWKVTYLDDGYYSIRPMYQQRMGLHATSNNVDITTTLGFNDILKDVVSYNRWGISATADQTAYNINNVGTTSLALCHVDGAPSPGLGVITAANSGSSASFNWNMELVSPTDYTADYKYKLLALNQYGVNRCGYFKGASQTISKYLDGNIYTSFYREMSKSDAIELLSESEIFIIHTHGERDRFMLSPSVDLLMSDIENYDLSGLKFALLLTCNTGMNFSATHISNNTPVNIVEQMVCCGAETVVGFSEKTLVSDCNRFADEFLIQAIEHGKTVEDAIQSLYSGNYERDMVNRSRVGGNTSLCLN